MTLAPFQVVRPASVDDAVRVLADNGPEAMIIAGGTDLVPNLQMRLFAPRVLVDIKRLKPLAGIEWDARNGLRIGALATLAETAQTPLVRTRFPALAAAVQSIAGPLQRNMGTIGGNVCLETRCLWYNQSEFWRQSLGGCLKKDGDVCHVAPGGRFCWAVWSGDSAPALLTLDAELEIAGPAGIRRVPLAEFYKDDGMDRIALGRDELVVAVRLPARAADRRGSYHKLRVRDSIDYPLAGVAVSMEVDASGVCRRARVALAAVNPAPRLVREASERLEGRRYSRELVEEAAHDAIRTGKPLTTSGSTPVYRREMVRLFTRRALEQLWQERGR
ncbi:MAG TPA: FAD binding domain-containing protein [Candidatus Acidoferrales bacterium]|nr:FAD binding domain-containing protein [Candidatus Acidoferrales bacterium]